MRGSTFTFEAWLNFNYTNLIPTEVALLCKSPTHQRRWRAGPNIQRLAGGSTGDLHSSPSSLEITVAYWKVNQAFNVKVLPRKRWKLTPARSAKQTHMSLVSAFWNRHTQRWAEFSFWTNPSQEGSEFSLLVTPPEVKKKKRTYW